MNYILIGLALGTSFSCAAVMDKETKNLVNQLINPSESGNAEVQRLLATGKIDLKKGAFRKARPLYLAAYEGHPETVRVLLDAGSDPNAIDEQLLALTIAATSPNTQAHAERHVPMANYHEIVRRSL